jgi:hypothetical protein
MGNVQAYRGRLAPALILAVLMALAVIVTLGINAAPASAQSTFTTCSPCHTLAGTHSGGNANHTGIACTTCHNNGGTANPPLPSACASCHGGTTAILSANATHTSSPQSCATTPGCHGVVPPVVAKTTMTLKASPTTLKLRKTVKFSGVAGPLSALASAKVAFKVERKVGTKWVKMKTTTKTVNATSGAFSWSYKTAKKGAHRVTASIAKKSTYTAKKMVKNFKVK